MMKDWFGKEERGGGGDELDESGNEVEREPRRPNPRANVERRSGSDTSPKRKGACFGPDPIWVADNVLVGAILVKRTPFHQMFWGSIEQWAFAACMLLFIWWDGPPDHHSCGSRLSRIL